MSVSGSDGQTERSADILLPARRNSMKHIATMMFDIATADALFRLSARKSRWPVSRTTDLFQTMLIIVNTCGIADCPWL